MSNEMAERLFAEGQKAGAAFVKQSAEFVQIGRLARHKEKCGVDWDGLEHTVRDIAKVMAGDDGDQTYVLADIRSTATDEEAPEHPEWAEGFIDGALEKYAELVEHV